MLSLDDNLVVCECVLIKKQLSNINRYSNFVVPFILTKNYQLKNATAKVATFRKFLNLIKEKFQ